MNKKVISNIFSLLVLQGANYILPLITLPYLVITLGVEKFGILAFSSAIIRYFAILIDYGFNLSATREISVARGNKEKISKIFSSVILIKFFLLLISFFILYISSLSFERISEYQDIYFFTFLMLIGNVLFPIWYFQGIEEMAYITKINIASKFFFTALIFLLVHSSSDYWLVPLINSIGFILGGLVAFIIALKRVSFSLSSWENIVYHFNNSTNLFISNASVTLFTASNVFILGLFANDTIVGIYSSIERLVMAIKNLFVPVYQGIFPWLAKKDIIKIREFIVKVLPIISFVALLISLCIFLFAKEILTLVYSNQEIVKYTYILQLFALVPFLSAINMLFNYLYFNAIKSYNIRMKIFLIAGIFNVIVALPLTQKYSIFGLTLSIVLTEVLLLILGVYFFKIQRINL